MRGLAVLLLCGLSLVRAGEVSFLWTGAVTSDSAVTVLGSEVVPEVRESGSEGKGMPPVRKSEGLAQSMRVDWARLKPDTAYEILVNGAAVGAFRTAPEVGRAASFAFAVGSCNGNPDSRTFAAIGSLKPAFMVVTGDFHYSDIAVNDPELFSRAILANLESPNQGAFWRKTPIVYTWDDHDYGPNDSDRTSPSRDASLKAYGGLVPHYPFALKGAGAGIAQSFAWGRIYFVVTDLRSERLKGREMMSREQIEWLKSELARAGREFPLVFWISSVPWNGNDSNADRWSGYVDERREIANFIAEEGLEGRVAILAGDAHMCAIDDGRHSDFSETGRAKIPVFQAAALERGPSYKGGPYSEGARPGAFQFGWVEVTDSGGEITVKWSARDATDPAGRKVVEADRDGSGPIEYEFRVPAR